jgi:hypothetical protein
MNDANSPQGRGATGEPEPCEHEWVYSGTTRGLSGAKTDKFFYSGNVVLKHYACMKCDKEMAIEDNEATHDD